MLRPCAPGACGRQSVPGGNIWPEDPDARLPARAQPGEPQPHLELHSGLLVRPAPCVCQRPLPAHWSAESAPSPPPPQPPQQPAPHQGAPCSRTCPSAPCFVRKNLLSSSKSHCPHWIPLEVRASGQTAPDPREPGSLESSCCISTASQPSLALGLFQNETKRACPSNPTDGD